MIVFLPLFRYGSRSGNLSPFSPWVTNWTLNCVFWCSLDHRMRRKLPSKKPRLLQTDIVGAPGSSVALRPTTDIDAGKRPRKKVPTAENAGRNESPHSLIRWTSSTQTNRTLDRKVGLSIISLHSLLRRCSRSTHMTWHLTHSMISHAKRTPTFRTLLRVSWQLEKADLWSFESSFT